jgi:protocatechuate 3,4-dioxygenase beta subunit
MSNRRITRRRAIGAAGGAGAAYLLAAAAPSGLKLLGGVEAPTDAAAASGMCVLDTPQMTEGPYWVDEMVNRSDIRSNTSSASANPGVVQSGVPLNLTINVYDAENNCAPIEGAHVDIWHANAYGVYSDEQVESSTGQNYLRGYQVTDSNGSVTFTTIYPGWYTGRAIHIHVRIRTFSGSTTVLNFTTQIFFSDSQNNTVMTGASPYNTRSHTTPDTTDSTDNILDESGSTNEQTNVITLSGSNGSGWSGTFNVALAGGSSGSSGSSGTTVAAGTITSAKVKRTSSGRRVLTLVLGLNERTAVTVRLKHGSTVVAKKSATLSSGTRTLHLTIDSSTPAEHARLTVKLAGASGRTVTRHRTLKIPARG